MKIKCDQCDFIAKHQHSLNVHKFMKHGIRKKPEVKFNIQGKRKYKKRVIAQPAPSTIIKYCPMCSCNLEAIQIALNLVK